MEINDIYVGGNYLKAADVAKPVVVTIKAIEIQDFPARDKDGNEIVKKKIVLSFDELVKQFVCNKTNSLVIAEFLGASNTDNWPGQKIKLWKGKTQFQGSMVDCISVSPA